MVTAALPPELVSGVILEELLATKVGPLEVFCQNPAFLQKCGLREVLGDASERPQITMDCLPGVMSKVQVVVGLQVDAQFS